MNSVRSKLAAEILTCWAGRPARELADALAPSAGGRGIGAGFIAAALPVLARASDDPIDADLVDHLLETWLA